MPEAIHYSSIYNSKKLETIQILINYGNPQFMMHNALMCNCKKKWEKWLYTVSERPPAYIVKREKSKVVSTIYGMLSFVHEGERHINAYTDLLLLSNINLPTYQASRFQVGGITP